MIQQNAFLVGKKSLKFFMSEEDFRFADTFLSENAGFTLESVALLKPQFVGWFIEHITQNPVWVAFCRCRFVLDGARSRQF